MNTEQTSKTVFTYIGYVLDETMLGEARTLTILPGKKSIQ